MGLFEGLPGATGLAVEHHGAVGEGPLPIEFVTARLAPEESRIAGLPVYSLWSYLSGAEQAVEIDGRAAPRRRYARGELRLLPPGAATRATGADPCTLFCITLPEETLARWVDRFAPEVVRPLAGIPPETFRAPVIEAAVERLAADAAGRGICPLYADALLQAIVAELCRRGRRAPFEAQAEAAALDRRRLDLLAAYTDAELHGKVATADLARVAGLPEPAFRRALKAATGLTPYQYVLGRRVLRARALVEGSARPLAEIAFRCGFASQSHMTDIFRARLGVSPGRLRRGA